MKYFWKKGYAQAIGITMTTAMAMRTDSLGMELRYCCKLTPTVGLLAIYSRLRIMLFSRACSESRRESVMYNEDWNQSFQ